MLSKEHKERLIDNYKKLSSQESLDCALKFFLMFADEIEKKFPGVEFTLKGRVKSPKSFMDKVAKTEEGHLIYDNIGFCLVIEKVPDEVEFKQKLCEKYVQDRINIGLKIDNEKSDIQLILEKYNNTINQLKEMDKNEEIIKNRIENLKNCKEPDNEFIYALKGLIVAKKIYQDLASFLIEQVVNKSEKFVDISNEYLSLKDNDINEMMATDIEDTVMKDPKFLKFLEKLNRTKFHYGGKSGDYIAYHNTFIIKNDSMIKGDNGEEAIDNFKTMFEVQAIAGQNNQIAIENHSSAPGKGRNIPRLMDDKKAFADLAIKSVPLFFIYQNGEKQAYILSNVESFYSYNQEILINTPAFAKKLISDNEYFSGIGYIVKLGPDGKLIKTEIKDNTKIKDITER